MKFRRKLTSVRSRTANRIGFRKHSKVDWYLEECNNEQTLRMLYDDSAFTWEGMSCDSYNLDAICDSFEEDGLWTYPDTPVVFYVTKGRDMNRMEHLTGTNAYPDDLNILSIMNDQLKINAMIPIQFNYGARWMDDIIDNNRMREGRRKRAYVGEFTQHDMEFLYEHGFEDSCLCGHGDSDGTVWCRDFPGGYEYIMINIDGAYGYGIADSSGDEESVYGIESICECDCKTIEEAYSHIASRRKHIARRKTANGAYRYVTNFRLLAPVNDIVAARDYLDEPMEEYLKSSVGYVGLTEYTLSKVDTIRWVLLDDESGQIILTCNGEMSQDELDLISIWVRGQCSDGIGEGFEQQDFSGYPEPVWEDFYDDELYEEEYYEWANSPSMSSFDYRTNDYKFVFDGIV